MAISKQSFGTLPNQVPVDLFTLTNKHGMQVKITNYGGIITSIQVPDKNGLLGEINLGFDNLKAYLQESQPYFGAIIGRYGNRIANGKFTIAGQSYNLAQNSASNHLHGGNKGFDKVVWQAEMIEKRNIPSLILTYLSPDGQEGYPGNLTCKIIYKLTNKNELQINYQATTDKPTVLNLTNHCYFNLKDGGATTCLNHELRIFADAFTPVDKNTIPTGEIKSVKRTPFNFLTSKKIGARIDQNNPQLKIGNGYDHNFVLKTGTNLKKAAKVIERESGRILEVFTTEPGLQLYTANWLDGSLIGHHDIAYEKRSAFCLETQHFPDSPNKPNFPATILRPDEVFQSTTVYKFSVIG
ncbi:MAG: aldose epimerase family protein [Saprospiraceae bacterium]